MNSEPAFPTPIISVMQHQGMTLRDYFAAKAMNGLVGAWGAHDLQDYKEIASDAYFLADAMLKAREA
jgi:hypothetical protein